MNTGSAGTIRSAAFGDALNSSDFVLLERRFAGTRAVIFDFYGTVVDDDLVIPPMWQTLNDLGFHSSAALQSMFEPDGFDGRLTPASSDDPSHEHWYRANWCRFIRLSGVPEHEIESTLTYVLDLHHRFTVRMVPHASSLITLLREHGMRVGLCSNWERSIEKYLEQGQLPEFDAIVLSADVGARKPHELMFRTAVERLGVAAHEAVFVGDDWSADIVGALRSDLTPVWIRGKRPSRGLFHLVAEFASLGDLDRYLRHLLAAAAPRRAERDANVRLPSRGGRGRRMYSSDPGLERH